MGKLAEVTTADLISNICNICDMQHSLHILNYADSVALTDEQLAELKPVLIEYRDELLSRISTTDYLIDTANLMQVYYRLVAALRSLEKYLAQVNFDVDSQRMSAKLSQDLLSSYSSIALNNLEKE